LLLKSDLSGISLRKKLCAPVDDKNYMLIHVKQEKEIQENGESKEESKEES
jgi:hypothetical protein